MFEDDYPNNFNYDDHFLNDNFNNFEENKEEIQSDGQNDSTDKVINNSKKTMDKFLYNLTKNDNDKGYQNYIANKNKKQNMMNNNMMNNNNFNKRLIQQQKMNINNNIGMNTQFSMNKNNFNLNLVNDYDNIINENNKNMKKITNNNLVPYSRPYKYLKNKNINNYVQNENKLINNYSANNYKNLKNNNINIIQNDNEFDFNMNNNLYNNINNKRNFSKNLKDKNINSGYNTNIDDNRRKVNQNLNDNNLNIENDYDNLTDFSKENNNKSRGKQYKNINKVDINKNKSQQNMYNSLLNTIKQLNTYNSENKKSVLSLQLQYDNFQKSILSKLAEFLSTSKLNYNTKLQTLNLQSEEKISDLSAKLEILNSEKKKLINEQKLFKDKIAQITSENDNLQKENKNLNLIIQKIKSEENNNNQNIQLIAESEFKNVELQKEKDSLLKSLEEKNNEIKELKEQKEKLNKEISKFKNIMKDVKITMDNEEILQKNLIELDTKYKQLQKTYNDLLEEKKGFQGQLNILRSQKNVYLKEYNKNKDLITNLKTTNETLNKERDEFKRQRDIYKNEIEIIKKNNDKMNSIKLNNDIKAHSNQKLREAMNNLITEKNNIEKKCDVLQKRIEDIDKEKIRSRSIPKKKY